MDRTAIADEIDRSIGALPDRKTETVRRLRRQYSKTLKAAPAEFVFAVAEALLDRHPWVGLELVHDHPAALDVIDLEMVERLGRPLDSWWTVDDFARRVSGPAWQRGRIPDEAVRGWAASDNRWWRRAALVSTVPLNLRAAGGTGDPARTLDICARLVGDRDDMVVKAMSWALRELAIRDPAAVRAFLDRHEVDMAARAKREVRHKLDTGVKRPRTTGQREASR